MVIPLWQAMGKANWELSATSAKDNKTHLRIFFIMTTSPFEIQLPVQTGSVFSYCVHQPTIKATITNCQATQPYAHLPSLLQFFFSLFEFFWLTGHNIFDIKHLRLLRQFNFSAG